MAARMHGLALAFLIGTMPPMAHAQEMTARQTVSFEAREDIRLYFGLLCHAVEASDQRAVQLQSYRLTNALTAYRMATGRDYPLGACNSFYLTPPHG